MEVRTAWPTVCWLDRRQFFSWAAADCGEEAGLPELTSGVEGRGEEGPGEPGEAGSDSFPPLLPPLTGLDRLELREEAAPNGALRREREGARGESELCDCISAGSAHSEGRRH